MSTQTINLPEIEFEDLLLAWERFLDALMGSQAPEDERDQSVGGDVCYQN